MDPDHFILATDEYEDGRAARETRWYPIVSGWLDLRITSLSLESEFTQTQKFGGKGLNVYENESLVGKGTLMSEASYGCDISLFSSEIVCQEINVRIRGIEGDVARWRLVGFEHPDDITSDVFHLDILLPLDRYTKIKEVGFNGHLERIDLRIDLKNHPKLYARNRGSGVFGDSAPFGSIKYMERRCEQSIDNLEDLEDSYLETLWRFKEEKQRDPDGVSVRVFEKMTR